ncbi:hypothetical protein [Mixta intestinalis]|uniref:hypothetical protein n=1 Tax=Mixta intestinalis TaxID=1615494 RepID=UPI00136993CB|nr:hypothetical protein [Mixta intestinalis]
MDKKDPWAVIRLKYFFFALLSCPCLLFFARSACDAALWKLFQTSLQPAINKFYCLIDRQLHHKCSLSGTIKGQPDYYSFKLLSFTQHSLHQPALHPSFFKQNASAWPVVCRYYLCDR